MHDQSYLSGSDQRYGRWDITQLGVAKRSSFWPRARVEYENEKGVIVKEQCIAAYTDALKECDAGSDRTHGFSALVGTMTYSLELGGFVQEGNPPWDEHVSFPPSEYQARLGSDNTAGDPYGPQCPGSRPGRRIFPDDLEKAISWFCVNGRPLKEPDNPLTTQSRYPPEGEAEFWQGDRYTMHLSMGAEPLKWSGGDRPYFDPDACKYVSRYSSMVAFCMILTSVQRIRL
jgi:hypothetical protein